jgi:membrane protein
MNVIALAFGLGMAGFDVFGVVLVVLLVASKTPKQRIAAFALIVLVGTVTAGVVASLLLGGSAELFAQALHRIPACIWVGAEGAASVGLLGWAAARLHRHIKSDKEPQEPQDSRVLQWLRRSIMLGGIIYAASAFTDPSFLAVIAVASREPLIVVIIAHVVWLLVSQGLFFGLVIAIMCDRHQPLIAWFERVRARYSTLIRSSITVVIVLCGLILLADMATFLLSGHWLLPE